MNDIFLSPKELLKSSVFQSLNCKRKNSNLLTSALMQQMVRSKLIKGNGERRSQNLLLQAVLLPRGQVQPGWAPAPSHPPLSLTQLPQRPASLICCFFAECGDNQIDYAPRYFMRKLSIKQMLFRLCSDS